MDTFHRAAPTTHPDPASHPPIGDAPLGTAVLDPERFAFLIDAVAAVAAIDAAQQLGIFTRLAAGPATPPVVARDCALGKRGAALLLAALASLGVVAVTDDGAYRQAFSNPAQLRTYFAPLSQVIRDDRPPVAVDTVAGAEMFYPDVVALLGTVFARAAEHAADRLHAPGLRILDVGAGAAPWSLALAARDPACRVTAVDVPAVLSTTRKAVTDAGREAQFTYLSGDLFAVEWNRGAYDLAIAGNICRLFAESANRHLLGRLGAALRPGGRLAIIDALPNETRDGPRSVLLYALGLLLRTSSGGVYPFSSYAAWLQEAGYAAVEQVDLSPSPPLSLITARHP